ncbi:E3 ubiquitin-protein ligase TRAIP-like [Diadema antillarum]|uniref:E3 ubiquitin-protein ligase TRAIP-like n=1 Tax=Diadema antillarum TaxID=105358 RepID=UPI003A89C3D3
MIPAVCSICADFFESDHVVVATPCGHVFHEHCLLQWINTSSTCPQCRQRTTQRSIVRLFFEVQDEEDGQLDPTRLKNQLGELQAELSKKQKEKSDLLEENDHLSDRTKTLDKNIKKLTKRLTDEQSTNEALKKQLSVMSYRMDEAKEAKREAKKLREKLQLFERYEAVMSQNADRVEDMLRDVGDGPRAVKELATYCTSLKREFENIKDSRKQLKDELGQLKKNMQQQSRLLSQRTKDTEALQHSVVSLQDDVQSLEAERAELKERIEVMSGLLDAHGGGKATPLQQALCITPINMSKKPRLSVPEEGDDIVLDPGDPSTPDLVLPSPSVETKNTCRELGIPFVKTTSLANKKKKTESDAAEASAWRSTLASSSLFNQRRPLQAVKNQCSIRKGYDGLGGHETFIQHPTIIRPNLKKVPRGVKRKPSGKPCQHPLPTLDKFMTS